MKIIKTKQGYIRIYDNQQVDWQTILGTKEKDK